MVSAFVELFLDAAPWLILGLFFAGMIKAFVPMNQLERHFGGHSKWNIVKAALIGAPLPLCSCGVIPAAMGIRRSGASKSTTASFLIATPETGVDSVSVSYALLGPFMATIRPFVAIFSAIVAGLMVHAMDDKKESPTITEQKNKSKCCGGKKEETKQTIPQKFSDGLRYAAFNIVDDIWLWLSIGIAFAAAAKVYLPPEFIMEYGQGLFAMTALMLVSIPMYICATASTPIAAGLLVSGVSPGAVLVFLLVGPATNIATLAVVGNELGKRSLVGYLTGLVGSAFAFGLFVDFLIQENVINIQAQLADVQQIVSPPIQTISAVILSVFMIISIMKWLRKKGGLLKTVSES
ncbi:SO_0444 family Cu/Zn efflux transporter [Algicola sagamiensis]|uniref:SO_0444 family Cu/Zn efflux transporter n=1 Tax=Algicola sagamiensis TaxID=163869 RepID=UPI000375898E|nr:SO_0444 family Cu/Zn efflux transporter [Algicola sagamiensis]